MRHSIKTAFACWIGIFLILPGCLCQLLACVGIELHDGSIQGGSKPAIIGQSLASAIDCHCDEDVAKVAETTPTDLASAGATAAVWLVVANASQPAAPPFFGSPAARAPPGVPCASASDFRALVSVWLI